MAALSDVVIAMAAECKVDDEVMKWLLKSNVRTIEDVATIAPTEALVDANLIEEAKNEGVKAFATMGPKAAVRKFWSRCRTLWTEEETAKSALSAATSTALAVAASQPVAPIDDGIPIKDFEAIVKAWESKHGFILPDAQLLIPAQQKALWRDFNQTNPQVSYWDARQLRQKSAINRKTDTLIAVTQGRPLEGVATISDAIDRTFELWSRCRAYLMTLSYISICTPSWFPYQSALEITDVLLKLMMDTYNGYCPDVATLTGAWAATSMHWAEQVRISKRPPSDVFTDVGRWQHKWNWVPADQSAMAAVEGGRPAPPRSEADNKELKDRLDQMTGQVRRLQSTADRGSGSERSTRNDTWPDIREPPRKVQKGAKGGKGGGKQGGGKGGKGGFAANNNDRRVGRNERRARR